MKKNVDLNKVISQHYTQFVDEYEIVESEEEDGSLKYTFHHKETGRLYLSLNYSSLKSFIEIRLPEIKAACLIKTNSVESLTDFIDLPAEEVIHYIHYIDIQGNPSFYYSADLSDKEQAILDIASDEVLSVKLLGVLAEIRLALHFSGLVYQKRSTHES